ALALAVQGGAVDAQGARGGVQRLGLCQHRLDVRAFQLVHGDRIAGAQAVGAVVPAAGSSRAEVVGTDLVATGENGGPFDDVLQFTDVAGPFVTQQAFAGRGREAA